MKSQRFKFFRGFTLIEMMVVLSIMGILAAIAYPAFSSSIRKSRRSDAFVSLSQLQMRQEKYRISHSSYGTLAQVVGSSTMISEKGYYNITVTSNNGGGFVLTATAVSGKSQSSDTGCTSLTLTQSNGSTVYSPSSCWLQ